MWEKGNSEQNENMHVYIDNITTTRSGKTVEIMMDMKSRRYFVRDEKPHQFKQTARMGAHLFKIQGWPYLMAVFAQSQNALDLRLALKQIYKKQTGEKENPLLKVLFDLREHDEALLQCFPNMKRLKVRGIHGLHVREAAFKGEALEESSEYQKYVKDPNFGGQIMNFGVPVGDETVIMSTIGRLYSTEGRQRMPVNVVFEILRNLLECHALVYEPTIDSYGQPQE